MSYEDAGPPAWSNEATLPSKPNGLNPVSGSD